MNLSESFHPCPKPSFKRTKPTAKMRGQIRPSVRKAVEIRSEDCCECCGKHKSKVWTLEMAHIKRRWKVQGETTANDLVRLCGPVTQTGTCHHWADYTREGRGWLEQFGELLKLRER